MSVMILNISSNMFGFGNAAMLFGICVIEEFDKLNGSKGTVMNVMVLFFVINIVGFVIFFLGVIGFRVSLGF